MTAAEAAKGPVIPTVEICPGTYQEQVTITKSLNVVHAPRSGRVTIEGLAAPAGSASNCQATDTASQVPQSVVEICGATKTGARHPHPAGRRFWRSCGPPTATTRLLPHLGLNRAFLYRTPVPATRLIRCDVHRKAI